LRALSRATPDGRSGAPLRQLIVESDYSGFDIAAFYSQFPNRHGQFEAPPTGAAEKEMSQ